MYFIITKSRFYCNVAYYLSVFNKWQKALKYKRKQMLLLSCTISFFIKESFHILFHCFNSTFKNAFNTHTHTDKNYTHPFIIFLFFVTVMQPVQYRASYFLALFVYFVVDNFLIICAHQNTANNHFPACLSINLIN